MRKLMASLVGLALCLTTATASAARVSLDLREQKAAVPSAPRKLMKVAAAPKSDVLRQGRLAAGATKVAPLNVGDTLGLQLFEGAEIELTLKELTDGSMGGRSFLAEANGYAGVKNAVVVETADGLQMDIQDYKTGKVYTVYSGADGVVVKELAPVRGQTVPTAEVPPPEMLLSADEVEAMGLTASDAPGDTRLDILVAFDANARSYAEHQGGGMTNFAQVAVQKMNAALANTGLSALFRFRLVGVTAVDAVEKDVHEALYAISAGEGGWAAIAEKREEVGADIVTTLIDTGSAYEGGGVGWALSDGMDPEGFSESAYNVCSIQSVALGHTMAHECGHNLGAGHSERQMTEPGPQLYDYSAGYYFTANGTSYHTIMAYSDDGRGNFYTPVPYFSSPDYTYLGVPVGDAKHDNTRTLRNTFRAASAWRERVVPMTYDVTFSPAGSTFEESLAVTLTAEKPDAVIRYTTDGSTPTVDSPVYSEPIILTETTTIRAIAVEDGVGGVPFEAKYWKANLGDALGAPELEWKTSPENPWQVQTDWALDGLATAGTAGSWLSATIEGPASVSFHEYARQDDELGYVISSFTIDGIPVFKFAGSYGNGFKQQTFDIPNGVHEIRLVCEGGCWLVDKFEVYHSRRPQLKTRLCNGGMETKVMLLHENPSATILFTLDGSDPKTEMAIAYTGPFFVSESVTVRAVAYEPGRGPSAESSYDVNIHHMGQHAIQSGVWSQDVNCALAAAKRDGRLVVVYYGDHKGNSASREFEVVAENSDFLSWAAVNGIYLVALDRSRDADFSDVRFFSVGRWLYNRLSQWAGIDAMSTPSFIVTSPDNLEHPLDARVGLKFSSAKELTAYFSSFLGKSEPLSRPEADSSAVAPDAYPFEVSLANPNDTGDIYFTLDGSEPTRENGTKYNGPLTIPKAGTTLKAVVWEGASGGVSGIPLVVTYGTAEDGTHEPSTMVPSEVTGTYVEAAGSLLRWKPVEGVSHYRIYVSDSDDFSSADLLGESKMPQYWDLVAVSDSRCYWVTSVSDEESSPSTSVRIEGIRPYVEFDLGASGVWATGIPMKKRIAVEFGQAAVAPPMCAGPGYRFVGWSEDVSCVKTNMSVVARYEPAMVEPFSSDVTADWFVDGTNGDDGNVGDAYNAPFASIQKAVSKASVGDRIIVNDGTYASVDVSRKAVSIRSLHGWAVTVIDGGNTNRCVSLSDGASLVGFTLRNGYAVHGGGVADGSATSCLIVDNVASETGGGASSCTLKGCIVARNKALNMDGGGVSGGTLNNCILHGNLSGGGASDSLMNNCVVVDNDGGGSVSCDLNNCIVWGNGFRTENIQGAYCYVCTDDWQKKGVGVLYDDPCFVDAERGDFRLRPDSPCIDAGLDYPAAFEQADFAGGVRVQGRRIDLGAYESEGGAKDPRWRLARTLFVDADNGSDANSGLDEHCPFATIQRAIEESVEGDEIVVADGVYAPICTFGRRISIRSVNGADRTVIDGEGTIGCARLSFGVDLGSTLIGFTLQNGFADHGGGANGGMLNACILRGNTAGWGGGSWLGSLENCLVVDNQAYYGGGSSSALTCCTIVGNRAWAGGGGAGAFECGTLYNCIVWSNVYAGGSAFCNVSSSCRCRHTCTTPPADGEGNLCADPLFVDAANGDYRLREDSPCINKGANGPVQSAVDLLGCARISGGTVDLGAFEREISAIVFDANGGSGVMPGVPVKDEFVDALPSCSFVRKGYTFAGWAMESGGEVVYADGAAVEGLSTAPGAMFVLYAKWTPHTFVVRFDANGGTGEMGDQMFVYDSEQALNSNAFVKSGYLFDGWTASEDVDGASFADGEVVSNLTETADAVVTLIARWVSCTYSIENGAANICGGNGNPAIQPSPIGAFAVPAKLGGCPVTSIGDAAFQGCELMTSVTIPASVTNFGSAVFVGCACLRAIEVAAGNPVFSSEDGILYDKERRKVICCPPGKVSVRLAPTVVEIGESAFYACSDLREIELPPGLKNVGYEAFCGCQRLGKLVLPVGLEVICSYAFAYCYDLASVKFPDSLELIDSGAFCDCGSLTSVTIPVGVMRIGSYAFGSCDCLEKVTFEGDKDQIDIHAWAFRDTPYADNLPFRMVVKDGVLTGFEGVLPAEVEIPSGVTQIGDSAFQDCKGLESVIIPEGVTSIGGMAFFGCSLLSDVLLPSTLRTIDGFAFFNTLLSEVELPASLMRIGNCAFDGIPALTAVYFKGNAPALDYRVSPFSSDTSEDLVVYVRHGSWGWSDPDSDALPDVWPPNSKDSRPIAYWEGEPALEQYHLRYEQVGGGGAAPNPSSYTPGDLPIVLTPPTRDGYRFLGWTLNGEPVTEIAAGTTGDLTLTATWDADYGCTYSLANGEVTLYKGWGKAAVSPLPIGDFVVPSELGGCPVTSIGDTAFDGCDQMTSVTIPASVMKLGSAVFRGCSKLTSVYFMGNAPQCDDWNTLSGTPENLTIYVRHGSWGWRDPQTDALPDAWPQNSMNSRQIAYWEDEPPILHFRISYELDGGENEAENPSSYMPEELPIALAPPTRDGYRFLGWTLNGEQVTQIAAGTTGDLTLTATWEADYHYSYSISNGKATLYKGGLFGEAAVSPLPVGEFVVPSELGGCPVTSIGDFAFAQCEKMTSVTIPASVTSIGEYVFVNCWSLTAIEVADDNPAFSSEDGVLYDKQKRTLICCPPGKTSVRIASSVVEIGYEAFSQCEQIEEIELPSGLKKIGDRAFSYCYALTGLTLPDGLEEIGSEAFHSCCFASIILPEGVRLYTSPFADSEVTSVYFRGNAPKTDDLSWLFDWTSEDLTVYVRHGSRGWIDLRTDELPELWPMNSSNSRRIAYWESEPPMELFRVAYELGGGVNAPGNPTTFAADDLPIVLAEPTRKGYRFLGWTPNGGVIPVGTAANVTFMALWEKIVEPPPVKPPEEPQSGEPMVVCAVKAEYRTKADVGVVPVKVVNVKEAVKIAVKGLPSGVKFTAKDVADRKSKKVTVPANSIYGTPTKSGVYAATVTVTPTDRKSKMTPIVKTLTFVVRNAGEHIVRADYDVAQGAVKGMGVYAKGKKVTLKATAAKGWVFAGWRSVGESADSTDLASWSFTMPNKDVKVSARFVTVAADKKSIGLKVDGTALSGGSGQETASPLKIVVKQGMYVEWPVAASALSATTVKVSGLPSGLKFTAKDVKATKTSAAVPANTIYGTPKTASKTDKNGKVTPSKVKITVTTAGKQKQEYVLNVTVRGIPAEGTFNGGMVGSGASLTSGRETASPLGGLVTLTVAKTGKISGKYLADGKTWTLSAAGFDTWDDKDRLTATLTAKSGKEVKTVALTYEDGYVCASLTSGQETPRIAPPSELASLGGYASPLFEAWRNEWKTAPQMSLAKTLKGKKVQVGEVLLTVGSNGAVTAKGTFGSYSASCSTVLIPVGSKGTYVVYLYFPPKAGKFAGWTGIAELVWDGYSLQIR